MAVSDVIGQEVVAGIAGSRVGVADARFRTRTAPAQQFQIQPVQTETDTSASKVESPERGAIRSRKPSWSTSPIGENRPHPMLPKPTILSRRRRRGKRLAMVSDQLAGRDITDERVLNAMRQVRRHLFVPKNLRDLAYADSPLPIGHDQTISQPYIVALMTQLGQPGQSARVLDVGTVRDTRRRFWPSWSSMFTASK